MGLNTESAEISTIDISGHDAVYYVDNHQFYHLIWDNGDYIIMIGSNIGRNELIDIANSVQKAEKQNYFCFSVTNPPSDLLCTNEGVKASELMLTKKEVFFCV